MRLRHVVTLPESCNQSSWLSAHLCHHTSARCRIGSKGRLASTGCGTWLCSDRPSQQITCLRSRATPCGRLNGRKNATVWMLLKVCAGDCCCDSVFLFDGSTFRFDGSAPYESIGIPCLFEKPCLTDVNTHIAHTQFATFVAFFVTYLHTRTPTVTRAHMRTHVPHTH
jgi:hypothetical protein